MSRFALQWLVPGGPGLLTHLMLLDNERPAPYVATAGHGVDKVQALLNLWATLIETHALPEVIDFVAVEYTRRTAKHPATPLANVSRNAVAAPLGTWQPECVDVPPVLTRTRIKEHADTSSPTETENCVEIVLGRPKPGAEHQRLRRHIKKHRRDVNH